jgi:hypothetical protein
MVNGVDTKADSVPEAEPQEPQLCLSGSESNIKWNTKSNMNTERPTLWETMLLLTLKRPCFVQIFWLFINCAAWIWNENFSKVGTGTAVNHYGFTTLGAEYILVPIYCAGWGQRGEEVGREPGDAA